MKHDFLQSPFKTKPKVKDFQRQTGLKADGIFGPVTQRVYYGITHPRICAVNDITIQARRSPCKFATKKITYSFHNSVSRLNVPLTKLKQVFRASFDRISQVCELKALLSQKMQSQNHILIQSRHIDGPSGVLAESESACRNYTTPKQWYDQEPWIIKDGPTTNYLDLGRISLHELIHALGLNYHIRKENDGTPNITEPYYNPNLWELGPGDIRELQKRYGIPTEPLPPRISSQPKKLLIGMQDETKWYTEGPFERID